MQPGAEVRAQGLPDPRRGQLRGRGARHGQGVRRRGGRASTSVSFALGGEFDFLSDLFEPAHVEIWYKDNELGGKGVLGDQGRQGQGPEVGAGHGRVRQGGHQGQRHLRHHHPGRRVRHPRLRLQGGRHRRARRHAEPRLEGARASPAAASRRSWCATPRAAGRSSARSQAIPSIPGVASQITGVYDDGAIQVEATVAYARGMAAGQFTIGAVQQADRPRDGQARRRAGQGPGGVRRGTGRAHPRALAQGDRGAASCCPAARSRSAARSGCQRRWRSSRARASTRSCSRSGSTSRSSGSRSPGQNVGIFATIAGGAQLQAFFGPAELKDLSLGITWNPDHEENTTVKGHAAPRPARRRRHPAQHLRRARRRHPRRSRPASAWRSAACSASRPRSARPSTSTGRPPRGWSSTPSRRRTPSRSSSSTSPASPASTSTCWLKTINLYEKKWALAAFAVRLRPPARRLAAGPLRGGQAVRALPFRRHLRGARHRPQGPAVGPGRTRHLTRSPGGEPCPTPPDPTPSPSDTAPADPHLTDATRRLRRAAVLHLDGDLDAAEAEYVALLADEPGHPAALNNLGLLRSQRGDADGALAAYDAIGADADLSPTALLNKANAYLALSQPARAVPLLQRAVTLDPDSPAWVALGQASLGRRRPRLGRGCLPPGLRATASPGRRPALLRVVPRRARRPALSGRAAVHRRAASTTATPRRGGSSAPSCCRCATSAPPPTPPAPPWRSNPTTYRRLRQYAVVLVALQRPDEAGVQLDHALSLDRAAELLVDRAVLHLAAGELEAARVLLDEAVVTDHSGTRRAVPRVRPAGWRPHRRGSGASGERRGARRTVRLAGPRGHGEAGGPNGVEPTRRDVTGPDRPGVAGSCVGMLVPPDQAQQGHVRRC